MKRSCVARPIERASDSLTLANWHRISELNLFIRNYISCVVLSISSAPSPMNVRTLIWIYNLFTGLHRDASQLNITFAQWQPQRASKQIGSIFFPDVFRLNKECHACLMKNDPLADCHLQLLLVRLVTFQAIKNIRYLILNNYLIRQRHKKERKKEKMI